MRQPYSVYSVYSFYSAYACPRAAKTLCAPAIVPQPPSRPHPRARPRTPALGVQPPRRASLAGAAASRKGASWGMRIPRNGRSIVGVCHHRVCSLGALGLSKANQAILCRPSKANQAILCSAGLPMPHTTARQTAGGPCATEHAIRGRSGSGSDAQRAPRPPPLPPSLTV